MSRLRLEKSARLLLVAVGLFAGLLLLEVGLRLGAAGASHEDRSGGSRWRPGHLRVLAVGDSNTWGLGVDRADAYPSQLEALLNEESAPPSQLVNLGVPGADSTRLAPGFPHLLERYEPDWALLLVGYNDFWLPPAQAAGGPGAGSVRGFLAEHSRAYKLLFMAYRALQGLPTQRRAPQPLFHSAGGRRLSENMIRSSRILRGQLGAMVQEARGRDVQLVMLTYPSPLPTYAAASEMLRQVAHDLEVPLIDVGASFSHAGGDRGPLFFPDGHPRALGYRLMARLVATRLEQLWEADGTRSEAGSAESVRLPPPR